MFTNSESWEKDKKRKKGRGSIVKEKNSKEKRTNRGQVSLIKVDLIWEKEVKLDLKKSNERHKERMR